ncbi:MAG: mannonate dehydratase [Clostridiales bacterium]|nr:mannonate dehydratase [Clostridiales bacterium]
MKLTFRWYGSDDPVTLENIRQIPGMTGVVSAIYDIPVGEAWPIEKIRDLKESVEKNGLELEVIESVPVHEDIKLGAGKRDYYIENYKQSIRNLGELGVKVICYNFMPVFDWTRSHLEHQLPDGSTTLVYYKEHVDLMNPLSGELSLPGWDSSYTKEGINELFKMYEKVDEEKLWENLGHFLNEIIPVAEEAGVKMAIHPDDPPWSIFGLPRIITSETNVDRFLDLYDSEHNGITLCTGSLGCTDKNDVVKLTRKYAGMKRINFMHIRNVKIVNEDSFEESAHHSEAGSIDVVGVLRALYEEGFTGYVRPDHGRMIWGETGKPGYGLYDRALGSQYILGIWDTMK